jgi:hypothetical protein
VNRDNDHLSTFEIRNNGYLDDLLVEEASVVPPSAALELHDGHGHGA